MPPPRSVSTLGGDASEAATTAFSRGRATPLVAEVAVMHRAPARALDTTLTPDRRRRRADVPVAVPSPRSGRAAGGVLDSMAATAGHAAMPPRDGAAPLTECGEPCPSRDGPVAGQGHLSASGRASGAAPGPAGQTVREPPRPLFNRPFPLRSEGAFGRVNGNATSHPVPGGGPRRCNRAWLLERLPALTTCHASACGRLLQKPTWRGRGPPPRQAQALRHHASRRTDHDGRTLLWGHANPPVSR